LARIRIGRGGRIQSSNDKGNARTASVGEKKFLCPLTDYTMEAINR
jgi:hypothetical protein